MIPKLSRRILPRPRLLARLHAAVGNGVTLLEAPAGFGKTTLLAQFAEDIDYTACWLTLDASSGSPEVLAHQLGVALSGSALIDPPATAAKLSDLQAYVNAEVARAVERSEAPVIVFIDNIHELVEAREAALLLSWFIESFPEGNEIVLAGRERPMLPAIMSALATGEILTLDGGELAFTTVEVAQLAEGSNRSVAEIMEATSGWPVGVLATLASGAAETVTSAAFDEYLQHEVWERVPEDLRPALRRFSLEPTIQRSAVEAEFGLTTWRGLTTWLSSHDFLCEHLTPYEFRLNPLLRHHIAAEFDRTDPEGYAAAFQLVVDDLVSGGNVPEAVELTRSAGNEGQLADLLERYSPQLIIQGALTLLLRAFECVSEPTLRRRPLLRGMYARVTAHLGDPEEAIRRADGLLRDDRSTPEARAHALLARLRAQRLLGRTDEAKATVQRLSDLARELEGLLQAEVNYQVAEYELSFTREFARAELLLRAVSEACDLGGYEPLGLLARSTLGQSLAMRGDAPAAATVLTRAAQGWRSLGRSSNLGWVLNNLGMSHIQAGDFTSAVTVLEEAVQEGLSCGNQRNVGYATGSLGDAELALGHFERARVHYEEAIRICATDALDESLAALSIAGLSAALLGKGDVQQADFFSRRALLVAVSSANSYEIAMCKLQQAAVELAAGNQVACIAEARDAAERFTQMDMLPMLAVARYRLAMACFKANRRAEAEQELAACSEAIAHPWMAATLEPLIRENPMFAQWAAARKCTGPALSELLARRSFELRAESSEVQVPAPLRFPPVTARSLGRVTVTVGDHEVTDEEWASARAKEMFFLLLSNRSGIRKEEAVEQLYPELPREKCNSAFHSNIYRIRKALYQDSVIKADDGIYQLNPEGVFEWDVEQFESSIERARQAASGSKERAQALQEALEMYAGPFASSFQSEWADTVRARLDDEANESLATLAGYFAGRQDYESAALCMERVLRANRYNEEAAYQFARYRARAGQVVQALRFIDEYSETYEEHLDAALPERFSDLRAAIAAGVAV